MAKCLQKNGCRGWFTVAMETAEGVKEAKKMHFLTIFPLKIGFKNFSKISSKYYGQKPAKS